MPDGTGNDRGVGDRIEIGGIAGGLSLTALRSLIDPATRESATIDVDLSRLRVSVPANALHEILSRALPQGSVTLGDGEVDLRPGDGSPGLKIGVPAAGVRLRVDATGLHVEAD